MDFLITAILTGIGFSAMGIGVFLSLRIFSIPDITTDGSFTLGGVVTAIGLTLGIHPLLVMLMAMIAGFIAGSTTGIIHTKLKVNALLSGILVMTALFSVSLLVLGRSNLPLLNTLTLFNLYTTNGTIVNTGIILAIVISVLVIFMSRLLRTDYGLAMRATGNSELMVRSLGVNSNSIKIVGLGIANACTALSGYLLVQFQGYADINMGIGIVISGLGSVMIGDTILGFVKNKSILLQLLAVVAGCIIFRLIIAAVLAIGLDPNYLKLLTSIIVLLFVAIGNKKIKLL